MTGQPRDEQGKFAGAGAAGIQRRSDRQKRIFRRLAGDGGVSTRPPEPEPEPAALPAPPTLAEQAWRRRRARANALLIQAGALPLPDSPPAPLPPLARSETDPIRDAAEDQLARYNRNR